MLMYVFCGGWEIHEVVILEDVYSWSCTVEMIRSDEIRSDFKA